MSLFRPALLLALAALLLPLAAVAKEKLKTIKFIDAETTQAFDEHAAEVRGEMDAGGRFEHIKPKERKEVEKQLDIIAAIMAKRMGEKLSDNDMLLIYAAQETANAILTERDGRRMVCEYSSPTGSHRKEHQCVTYADRMRARKESEQYMRETRMKSPSQIGF
jgi:hypothetical protein